MKGYVILWIKGYVMLWIKGYGFLSFARKYKKNY